MPREHGALYVVNQKAPAFDRGFYLSRGFCSQAERISVAPALEASPSILHWTCMAIAPLSSLVHQLGDGKKA